MNRAQQLKQLRELEVENFFNSDIYSMIINAVDDIIKEQIKSNETMVEIRFIQKRMFFNKTKIKRQSSTYFVIYFDERGIKISSEEIADNLSGNIRSQGFYVDANDISWEPRLYISWQNV